MLNRPVLFFGFTWLGVIASAFEEAQLHRLLVPGNRLVIYNHSQEFFIAKSIIHELNPTFLMFLSDWSHISIVVVLNFKGLVTFFVAIIPPNLLFDL
jgi:hypothetical protein